LELPLEPLFDVPVDELPISRELLDLSLEPLAPISRWDPLCVPLELISL
jgi:hypothetical protein